jgi:hypothetical protein
MTLIKKRDVESYFASRNRSGVHLKTPRSLPTAQPLSQPSAIGLPKAVPVLVVPSSGIVSGPQASKSAQA